MSAALVRRTRQRRLAQPPTPVRRTKAGAVAVSRDLTGSYGRYVVIQDPTVPRITVYYAHLSIRTVRVGQKVAAGQVTLSY